MAETTHECCNCGWKGTAEEKISQPAESGMGTIDTCPMCKQFNFYTYPSVDTGGTISSENFHSKVE